MDLGTFTITDLAQLPAFAAAWFFFQKWQAAEKREQERILKDNELFRRIALKGVSDEVA